MIECVPGVRPVAVNTAMPPESEILPRSSPVVESRKSIIPVGAPEPGAAAVTVAVSVIDWPNGLLLVADACADVVVASCLIVRLAAVEVLPWSFVSPL